MAQQLLGNRLSDVAGSDDHGVLDIRRASTDEPAANRARQRHHERGEDPEEEELLDLRMRDAAQPAECEEEPGADGHHVENVRPLIRRRVIRPLVVQAVEPVHAGDEHPARKRGDEEQNLREEVERAG
jgi:hypothetical protein